MLQSALCNEHLDKLSAAGFAYRSFETPCLWNHLEERFNAVHHIGARFVNIPEPQLKDLVQAGESTLLRSFVDSLNNYGRIERTFCVVTAPYIIGSPAMRPLLEDERERLIQLVIYPGTLRETIVTLLPVTDDDMPYTNEITFEGGVYADGKTVGCFDVHPGTRESLHKDFSSSGEEMVFLITPSEVRYMLGEMRYMADQITIATDDECHAMVDAALKVIA